jgi:hypothetical protein
VSIDLLQVRDARQKFFERHCAQPTELRCTQGFRLSYLEKVGIDSYDSIPLVVDDRERERFPYFRFH